MKIIYIHKAEFHKRPPVISAVMILADLGYEITLITCGISDELYKKLSSKGINIQVLQRDRNLNKIIGYIYFRTKTFKIIKNIYKTDNNIVLWIEGAQTLLALSGRIKKYPYILQIQELYENSKILLKVISKVIHGAKAVFMPEYNRTFIYQIWFNLKNRPFVLPNKPYFLPDKSELEILKDKYKEQLQKIEKKKVILYQGGISKVRMLEYMAKAIKEINDDYILVLLGNEQESGYIDKLLSINNKSIVHIPFLPAPDYLVFSTIAYIGYVCYAPTSLNNAFCAPNKINEYSAFSIPMIGNNIPGLKTIFDLSKSGVIIEENNIESVKKAILKIDANYKFYKENAKNIFNMYDNKNTISTVLKDAFYENSRNY